MSLQNENIEASDFDGDLSALGRLFARRPVQRTSEELLNVGDVEDGADVDSDEVEVAEIEVAK